MSDLQSLSRLTGLALSLRQQEMQTLAAKEAQTRKLLATLDDNRRRTQHLDAKDTVRRQLGSDILWQAWLDQKQRNLNISLAQTLAQKEPVIHRLRQAFGRDRAVQGLLQIEAAKLKKYKW